MKFNPRVPEYRHYEDVVGTLQDGWLAQFRGNSWLSQLIQYGTGGPHSHTGMLARTNGTVDLLEVREFYGGRRVPLEDQVRANPGRIDIFSPDLNRWPKACPKGAVETMRILTGRRYGYMGVARLALRKVPLLWRLWPISTDDDSVLEDSVGAPFCSHAFTYAWRVGGELDPTPRKPDYMVSPNDLTWSMFFSYEFTLVP